MLVLSFTGSNNPCRSDGLSHTKFGIISMELSILYFKGFQISIK